MSSACPATTAASFFPLGNTGPSMPPSRNSSGIDVVATAGILQSRPYTVIDVLTKWEAQVEEMAARSSISRYLSSRGPAQRQARKNLVEWFKTSRSPERHIATFVRSISDSMSEPRIEAAIDLLVMLGPQVTRLAVQVAVQPQPTDSTAAYVLATAAGRIDSSLIWFFQSSPNDGCREAVIGLVGDLSDEEGLSVLRQLASDQNQSVRRLALAALAD